MSGWTRPSASESPPLRLLAVVPPMLSTIHHKTQTADKIRLEWSSINVCLQVLGWSEAEDEVVAVEVGELRWLWYLADVTSLAKSGFRQR